MIGRKAFMDIGKALVGTTHISRDQFFAEKRLLLQSTSERPRVNTDFTTNTLSKKI